MSELAQVVAYVFRQQGRDRLGRNEFKQFLAFRLNWYPPAQAAQLLERAVAAGLLLAEGDAVRPGFDIAAVELPLSFRGTAAALAGPAVAPAPEAEAPEPPPVLDAALQDRARALRELARGMLSEEAATLLAMRERGADVRSRASQALAALQAGAASGLSD